MRRFVPIAALVLTPVLGLAACGDDDSGAATTTTTSSTTTEKPRSTTTTTDPADVEAEVVEAYEDAWADFFRAGDPPDPDAAFLADHRTGENLASTRDGLESIKAEGVVLRGSYEAGIVSVDVDGDTARIEDCGFDRGELRLQQTGEVIDAPDDEPDGLAVDLIRVDGQWKIETLLKAPRVCEESNNTENSDSEET